MGSQWVERGCRTPGAGISGTGIIQREGVYMVLRGALRVSRSKSTHLWEKNHVYCGVEVETVKYAQAKPVFIFRIRS